MRKSTNYELNILDEDDFYNEELFNENTEKIDEVMKSLDTPEYDISLQKDVEDLSSGESLKVALRKLAKAVADYISHKADKVAHTTAEERAAWKTKIEHLGLESQRIKIKERGWYRIAMIKLPGSYGNETTFQLGRVWAPLPEMIDFTLIKSYHPSNCQLIVNRRSGNVYTTKVRILYKGTRPQDNVVYLDVYSNTTHETLIDGLNVRILHDFSTNTNSDERFRWKYLDEYTGELAEIPEGYSAIEFDLTKHQIQADTARIKSIESLDANGNTITMQGLFTKIQEKIDKKSISNNFTTSDETMIAAAPLVKQLYEENQSLKEEISTLNSNKISGSSMSWIPNGTTMSSLLAVPGISCYSVNPGMSPSPSIENMTQYGTIIVFKLSEYGVAIYLSVLGGMQIFNNNDNKWSIVKYDG